MRLEYVLSAIVALAFAAGPVNAATNRVPPLGLLLSPSDERELLQGTEALAREINGLKGELIPDVQIFHKAVHWAVVHGEIYRTNEVQVAGRLLRQGLARAKELASGRPSWLAATGLVVRAFRSEIDDSVQPYGLIVPPFTRDRKYRLDVWLHGRDNQLTELKFLNDRQRSYGEFAPSETFVLHPYGRYCNAFKFAGERDVFEAIDHVRKFYPIDDRRITIRGFSMGGAGAWHLAAHFPGFWAAAAPGAGFAETAEYTQILKRATPPWWERLLWNWYDATASAANFNNCPVIAYSGELDKQRQAADLMAKALEREGLELKHLIGPQTEHKYEPGTKQRLEKEFSAVVAAGKPALPAHVHLTTYTLRYNSNHWIRVEGLENHWQRSDVDAELLPDLGMIRVKTRNISALSLLFPEKQTLDLAIDKNLYPAIKVFTKGGGARLEKSGTNWRVVSDDNHSLRKRPGLQGPIDDAFTGRFIMLAPGREASAWVHREFSRATNEWRAQFRGVARVKSEAELTPADVAQSHLVIWGAPSNSDLLRQVLRQLPIEWSEHSFRFAGRKYTTSRYMPAFLFPNPLSPTRYIVVNSGFTFHEAGAGSNALQTPKRPDFVVIDTEATDAQKIALAGFFDERWRVTDNSTRPRL